MGAIGLGDRAALLKSGWPMLRRALGHGRSEPRQAAVEAVAFLLEPAPTDGEADSPFDDLVALGRRDDAARALLEGVLPTLERRGEYRRCLEVQARLDRVHAESPPLGTAALSAMSSVRAGYLWALGDAPAALNAAKVAASTLMATAPVDEQRSSDMSAIGDHRSWDDLDLPAIEGFAEGQSFEEEFMK
jgi:hypothetical protein